MAGVRSLLGQRQPELTAGAGPQDTDVAQQAQGHYRRGRTVMRAGELAQAIAEFDRATELVPDYAEAIAARAEALDMLGQSEAAKPEYERARQLWAAVRPGAPDRRYVFRRPGRFTFEIESYELALNRIKTGSFPHMACGNALLVLGRPGEALKQYERALKLKINDPDLTALTGEALSMMGQYLRAIEAFDFALAVNSKDADTLSARAIACMALGKVDEADADWRRQIALLGQEQPAARACVAFRLTDYALAVTEFGRAIEKEPADAYWRLYRLTAQRRLGISGSAADAAPTNAWPSPLFALHAGAISADEVLAQADTDGRRTEALFQLGVLALPDDPGLAAERWRDVVASGAPALIEHAAARNELAKLGA